MKLGVSLDVHSLASLAVEALNLLCAGDIDALSSRFGYALSYDRGPAEAIREDLQRCLREVGANALSLDVGIPSPKVSFFRPNDSGLIALVECLAGTDNGSTLLVELVVTGDETERHLTLEDISAFA